MLDEKINWIKSTYCADSTCIEAALISDGAEIGVRDSKRPEQPYLTFAPNVWHEFLDAVTSGEFNTH